MLVMAVDVGKWARLPIPKINGYGISKVAPAYGPKQGKSVKPIQLD